MIQIRFQFVDTLNTTSFGTPCTRTVNVASKCLLEHVM